MPDPAVLTFPRGVSDPRCPAGHLIAVDTTTDHRLLWHIASALAISATNDHLRELGKNVRQYLNVTCQHHWHDYDGDADIPAHQQCLWCNDVIWLDGQPLTAVDDRLVRDDQ